MSTDESPVPATETKKRRSASTPAADLNLRDLSLNVNTKWLITPAITLMWTTAADFANTANQFDTSLNERNATGGGRAAVTGKLKDLDNNINKMQEYVKVYLKDKFDKNSFTTYLPQFGITKQGNTWAFPTDRNKRQASLQLTVKAFAEHGFQDKKYGLAYWQGILTEYETALNLAVNTDSEVAGLVSVKNEHRKQIQKTLNALIHIIKGNYPDTYASVLREWGFQKEKY